MKNHLKMTLPKQLSILLIAILITACGGKKEDKKEGFSYEKKTETSEKAESNPNAIVLTSNDAMQFNKKEIVVKAGQKVTLTLKHIGKMDKQVMGHNFVLLKQGVDLNAFGNKAAAFANNAYIPIDTEDVIAYTKLIGGGETTVIEFDAPATGEYEFLCSFPGHYALMKGVFIVE
ncbi:azurin [Changchengzhania lutea]|uniref:azurin n=1 Tax=Changchengzhania lutea TaxID=2049305 RepID=UPI00115F2ADF|nr:azurin [Changchengzhania lutea]